MIRKLRVRIISFLLILLMVFSFGVGRAQEIEAIRSLQNSQKLNLPLKRRAPLGEESAREKEKVSPEKVKPEAFYPEYKWVYGDSLIKLRRVPLIYKGEVFLEQDDFLQVLKVLQVRDWSLEKEKELSDGRVIAKFTYKDIPPKRYYFEPLFYKGVYIPFDALRKTLGYEIIIDEEHSRIWIVPSLQDIVVLKDAVVLKFAGRLRIGKTFYLTDPFRFVIDLKDAAVTKDLFREMDISDHKYLRSIRTSQFTIVPPIARVVLDLKKGAKVFRITKIKPNEIHIAFSDKYEAPLTTPKENPLPSEKGKPVNIYQITPLRSGNRISITLRKSKGGEFSFSIKKLRDGRTYVDIYNAILRVSKNTLKVNYGDVEKIRYSQYQKKPIPVVRVVIYSKGSGELRLFEKRDDILSFIYVPEREELELPSPEKVKGIVVCIDPGHGGSDPGAKSPYITLDEKDITLSIARMVYADLKRAGLSPVMTRYTDRDVLSPEASDAMELNARVEIAKKSKARAFVSIHINASPNKYLDGLMTFYHKDIDYPLAFAIHSRLVRLGLFRDRGIRRADFYVLRKSTMPAVLLELGFLTNRGDAMKLASLTVRRKLAKAIALGIIDYLTGRSEIAE